MQPPLTDAEADPESREQANNCNPEFLFIAEDSHLFPTLEHPLDKGGLGMDYSWGIGEMHGARKFLKANPLYRNVSDLFYRNPVHPSLVNYINSHDETSHNKSRFVSCISGNLGREAELRMAQLMHVHLYFNRPGVPMLFQGDLLGDPGRWDHETPANEALEAEKPHAEYKAFMGRLAALHEQALATSREDWASQKILVEDSARKITAVMRFAEKKTDTLLTISNWDSVAHKNYRIRLPFGTKYKLLLTNQDGQFPIEFSTLGTPGDRSIQLSLPPQSTAIYQVAE